MDHWKEKDLPPSASVDLGPSSSEPRQRTEVEVKDPATARKVLKADREKLRRDRLNEQFLELGNSLDPDRPKNDKATILTDTIQVLKDLTAEVDRLKAEHSVLADESRELMQEKNELREEKASLKSDIENLNAQYQQRVRVMFPWAGIDPSVVMAPSYPYPVPLPVASGPLTMHPSLQPYPFFGNAAPGVIPNPCSTFIPYSPAVSPPIEQPSQHASSSHVSSRRDSRKKSTNDYAGASGDKCEDSNDVATELELKTPGLTSKQDLSAGENREKHAQRKEKNVSNGSYSSVYSSSQSFQDRSSRTTEGGSI